jgi:hypothetical protein
MGIIGCPFAQLKEKEMRKDEQFRNIQNLQRKEGRNIEKKYLQKDEGIVNHLFGRKSTTSSFAIFS